MATSNTASTKTGDSLQGVLSDPNTQAMILQLINHYQNSRARGDATDVANNTLAGIEANAPTGMDFSGFMPLMDVINDPSFSRGNAITDSQGFIQQIFNDFEKQSLPKIYSNPRASGIYNDTSTQLLANDAFSSAVAKGQSQLVQNILAYAQARRNQLDPVIQLMQGMVSNNNAMMSAEASQSNALLQAMQNAGTAGATAAAGNRADNTQSALALLNAATNWYTNYQNQQKNPYNDPNLTQSNTVTTSDGGTFGN